MWRMNMKDDQICNDDTSKFEWEKVSESDFKLARFEFATVADDESNSIFTSGGYGYNDRNDSRVEVKCMECFHPAIKASTDDKSEDININDSWMCEQLPDLPFKRRAHIAVRVKNCIYLFGGYGYGDKKDSSHVDNNNVDQTCLGLVHEVHVFDIHTKTWSMSPDVPSNMDTYGLSSVVIKDRWIVLLSRKGQENCFIFDTKMQAWFQGGVWRKKKKCLNDQGIMPGYNHLKIVALKNSTDIIVDGQGELQRINDRSLTFTIIN